MVLILVGNKADREAEREVSTKTGEQFAAEHGMPFLETSANTGENVYTLFERVVQII